MFLSPRSFCPGLALRVLLALAVPMISAGLSLALPSSALAETWPSPAPRLVKDIREDGVGSTVRVDASAVLGDRVFLAMTDPVHGQELWVTDGTEAGTRRVKEVRSGPVGAGISEIVASGARVFFNADDGVNGRSLWVSDGTEEGTLRLSGRLARTEAGVNPVSLQAFAGGVIFAGESEDGRCGIWVSDGTPAGLTLLKNMPVSSFQTWTLQFAVVGNTAYFTLGPMGVPASPPFSIETDPVYGSEVWKTDGTVKGTVLVRDLLPGKAGSAPQFLGSHLGRLYFIARSPAWEPALWSTTGTSKSTVRGPMPAPNPGVFAVADGKAYVAFTNSDHPWVTDGTVKGSRMIRPNETYRTPLTLLRGLGQRLFAVYDFGLRVYQVRTGEMQTLLSLLGGEEGERERITDMVTTADRAFFLTGSAANPDRHLWVTDGTVDGTHPLAPGFESGGSITYTGGLVTTGTHAFFTAWEAGVGSRLWKSDGTAGGTVPVKAIEGENQSSLPGSLLSSGGVLYFSADDGVHGAELWKSDGTGPGTEMVRDLLPGAAGSGIEQIVELRGQVYVTANPDNLSRQIWTTDGTTEGTVLLKSFPTAYSDREAVHLMATDSFVFFAATEPSIPGQYPEEVWRTDGTLAGTLRVKDIQPGESGVSPDFLGTVGPRLYFKARVGGLEQVWVTDGTEAGTIKVCDLSNRTWECMMADGQVYVSRGGGYLARVTQSWLTDLGYQNGNITLQAASPAVAGKPELLYFTTDSSYDKTIQTLHACASGSMPVLLATMPRYSAIFFCEGQAVFARTAYDKNYLVCTDGTVAGTRTLIPDVIHSVAGVSGDRIFFLVPEGDAGKTRLESVRLDGSDRQILLHQAWAPVIKILHQEGDTVFFARSATAPTGFYPEGNTYSWTLWETQGTADTTREIPGSSWSSTGTLAAKALTKRGDRLYLAASAPETGRELYALDLEGRLEISLSPADGGGALTEGATVEMEPRALLQPCLRTLHLRNRGQRPLTGLSVSLSTPEMSDYIISAGEIGTLAPGALAEVQITFTPQQAGLRQTSLQITGTARLPLSQTLHLRGLGLGSADAPLIWRAAASRLVLAGQGTTFTAGVTTAQPEIPTHEWRRVGPNAGASVPLSTATALTLPAVQAADVAAYTLTVSSGTGSVTSPSAYLGAVSPMTATVTPVLLGKPLTLTCTARAPAGTTLSYQWLRDGLPLNTGHGSRLQGSQSATLKIDPLTHVDVATYDCQVTLHAPDGEARLTHGATTLEVITLPEVRLDATRLTTFVGEEVQLQLATLQEVPGTRFTVKGLPPGLKMTPQGLITGRPTKALPAAPPSYLPQRYQVTFTPINVAGTGTPRLLEWQILPLIPAGAYDGLFDRNGDLDGGRALGSRLQITMATTGAFSGKLTHGGAVYAFNQTAMKLTQTRFMEAESRITVSRGRTLKPLTLSLNSYPSGLGIGLEDNTGNSTGGHIERQAADSSGFNAYYTAVLSPVISAPRADVPQGSGYLTATVKSGRITWKGRLADATAVTGSSLIAESGAFFLHQDLYKLTGSLHGTARLDARNLPFFNGEDLEWLKAAETPGKNRVYKGGILRHPLSFYGVAYQVPKGDLLMNADLRSYNAHLEITLAGETEPDLPQQLSLSASHKVTLHPAEEYAAASVTRLSVAAGTGLFKGTAVIRHPVPALTRTVSFEGVILHANSFGEGSFLLPDLPDDSATPPTTLKTSSLQSCKIEINPN